VVAWTLNQLARSERESLEALLATGAHIGSALDAKDTSATRAAQSERRSLLKQLGRTASDILRSAGHAASSGHVEKVRSALLQATTDEDVAAAILAGRLSKEPVGEALPDVFGGSGEPGADVDEPAEDALAGRRIDRAQRRVDELRTEAETVSRRAAELAREAESARVHAEAAEDNARAAERSAERVLRHLEEAEEELRRVKG
jgi:hypothetical protein